MTGLRICEARIAADGTWPFRSSNLTWRAPNPQPGGYGGRELVFDPFPAYAHDVTVVRRVAQHAQRKFAPIWDVDIHVCDREEMGRSNGHSDIHEGGYWENGEYVKGMPTGVIVLSGKRIPPHPALTRYLVGHEYGHNVEWMIAWSRGAKNVHDGGVVEEYATLRGLPGSSLHHGEGGTWHDSATEIFACDFRLLVLGIEPDFWPHPGTPRPEGIKPLCKWWRKALAETRDAACAGGKPA